MQSRVGSYVPNGLNQYTSIGGQAITHDANGNLTYDGTLTYTYDMEDRLVGTTGGASSSLTYDPLGRLFQATIAGTTTQFLYDGDALVGEYQGGALTRRYVHGDRVDEPWVQYNGENVGSSFRRYLHADHQGSIIAHSDSSGAVINKLAYDSYGIPATTNIDRFGFTGQAWLSQLGLFHYKARMYSPKLGRFLQTDPVGYEDDLNLYAYVGNDPLNHTDPTGAVRLLPAMQLPVSTPLIVASRVPPIVQPLGRPVTVEQAVRQALRGSPQTSDNVPTNIQAAKPQPAPAPKPAAEPERVDPTQLLRGYRDLKPETRQPESLRSTVRPDPISAEDTGLGLASRLARAAMDLAESLRDLISGGGGPALQPQPSSGPVVEILCSNPQDCTA